MTQRSYNILPLTIIKKLKLRVAVKSLVIIIIHSLRTQGMRLNHGSALP